MNHSMLYVVSYLGHYRKPKISGPLFVTWKLIPMQRLMGLCLPSFSNPKPSTTLSDTFIITYILNSSLNTPILPLTESWLLPKHPLQPSQMAAGVSPLTLIHQTYRWGSSPPAENLYTAFFRCTLFCPKNLWL